MDEINVDVHNLNGSALRQYISITLTRHQALLLVKSMAAQLVSDNPNTGEEIQYTGIIHLPSDPKNERGERTHGLISLIVADSPSSCDRCRISLKENKYYKRPATYFCIYCAQKSMDVICDAK